MNNRFAVMGNPIEHSLSPIIHQWFARETGCALTYQKILIQLPYFEQQVEDFFNQGGIGLNITAPFKQRAFAMANHRTRRCAMAKAANTLWCNADGVQADNTDGAGLLRDLTKYVKVRDKRVLILGAGGGARGILAPLLAAMPALVTIANRSAEKAEALCMDFSLPTSCSMTTLRGDFDLIINATSASLTGKPLSLPSTILTPSTICYDLAYQNKSPTPFILWAQSHGCIAIDGLGMLVEQAAEAFSIWHGVTPDVMPVLAYLRSGI